MADAGTSDAGAAQGSPAMSHTKGEFQTPRRCSRRSFRQCTTTTSDVCLVNTENLEPKNCYSSTAPKEGRPLNNCVSVSANSVISGKSASAFSSIPKTPRNCSLQRNFENAEMDLNFHGQYRSPTPDSEKYEELDASVILTEEVQDENLYGSYAETDLDNLDETTDFSQKYKERIYSYQNFKGSQIKGADTLKNFQFPAEETSTVFSQDTVKVYCTEGTPVVMSSASSMTDLRDGAEIGNAPKSRKRSNREPKEVQIEETEAYNKSESANKQDRSVLSTEKARHGTPPTRETKMVSFVEEINFAEETPLMFSRSSSLGSLSSFDQQGTNDDHGLMTGNSSQQTSGNISPSDLPDSPSETMPPSPRHASRRPVFHLPPGVYPLPPPVDSVFKEMPQRFAEEDTPCRISQATSLSSLTIDDVPCTSEVPCEVEMKSDGVFSDVKHKFAEEGTPFQISRAESLSPLPIDDDYNAGEQNEAEVVKDGTHKRNESEKVNGMLKQESNYFNSQKCGNAAIACNVAYHGSPRLPQKHEYAYQNIASNVIADKRCERMPVPVQNHVPAANAIGVTSRRIAKVQIHTSNHGEDFGDDDIFGDAKREFMEEGTPYQYSRRTSLSSLSFDDEPVSSAAREPVLDAQSPTWNSDLSNSDVRHPQGHPNRSLTFSPGYASPSGRLQSSTFTDETRVYCAEDTPANISHSASYNDLASVARERSMHERRDWASNIDEDSIPAEFDQLEMLTHENTDESKVEKCTQISDSCQQAPLERNLSNINSSVHSPSTSEAVHHPQNVPSSCPKKAQFKSENNADSVLNLCGSTRRPSDSGAGAVFRKKFGSDGNIHYDDALPGRKLVGNGQSKSTVYLTNVDVPRFQVMHSAYRAEQFPRACQTRAQHEDTTSRDMNDGDAVYNTTKHHVSMPKTYPSDEDDEVDDSAIQAEVIRRGMPQSSSSPIFSAIPHINPEQTAAGNQTSSCVEYDDEANDSRILEELIRLGKQQVSPSVPKGENRTSHTSRSRTKEHLVFPPSSQLSDQGVKPMQASAPHTFNVPSKHDPQFQNMLEYNRAGLAGDRSERVGKVHKQNLVRYEQRSCSERRQKPVNVLQSDVGHTSACDVPELYKRNQFKDGGSVNYNDFVFRKLDNVVTQCYASPMISRQLPSHKQVFQQFGKGNVSACEPSKDSVHLTESTQPPTTQKPSLPQAAQVPEPVISDSEDEELDLKCLRELILKGSSGLSDALPKLPPVRDRTKLPDRPAASPTSPQKKTPTGSDDDALQAMAHLTVSSPTSKTDIVYTPSCSFLDCSTQTDDLDSPPIPATGASNIVVQADTVPKICKDSVTEADSASHSTCTRKDGLQNAVKPVDLFPSASFTIDSQCNRPDASRQVTAAKPHREKLPSSPIIRDQEKSSVSSNTEHCQDASEVSSERIEIRAYSQANNGQERKKYDMPPEPPADSMDRVTAIRIKLPNGRTLTRRFVATWELRVLLTFLESLGYPKDRFKILKNWRRQELSTSNPAQTLEQLKLYPKKTLTIKER